MSINVTVTGNPVYLGRGKVLLTDIEAAKKNEWLRRRKIRLQQARQQAKDLAQSVRKKVSCEENVLGKKEEEKQAKEENQCRQEQISSLQTEFQESLNSIGTGHHLALIQSECDALIREKQDLREAIAKARGAIAEERLKAEKCIQKEKSQMCLGRKKMARQIEDLRSTLVSNLPEVKSSVSQTKKSIIKTQVTRNTELEEENATDCERIIVTPTKRFAESSRQRNPTSRCSLSPPRSIRQPSTSRAKKSEPNDDSLDEEDSDDSGVTWPSRSARVTKEPLPAEPPRVRFYDHNSRLAKSSPRPSYSITQMNPFDQPDMSEAIAEEEEAIVRKENLDVLARREKMIRGNKALRKERAKKEADKFLKEIRELHRNEKIQIAVEGTYPCDMHVRDFKRRGINGEQRKQADIMKFLRSSEDVGVKQHDLSSASTTNEINFKTCDSNYAGVKVTKTNLKSPPEMSCDTSSVNEYTLEELVNKLKIQRAKHQEELESKFGVMDIDEDDIPPWVRSQKCDQETAGPSGIRFAPFVQNRRGSPAVDEKSSKHCSCSSRCGCFKHETEENFPKEKEIKTKNLEDNKDINTPDCERTHDDSERERAKDNECMNISHVDNERGKNLTVGQPQQQCVNDEVKDVSMASGSPGRSSLESEMASSKCSTQSDTVESSLTFEGIKVVVKVCEKGKKKKERLSGEGPQTTDKDIQTSLEPPEENAVNRNTTWNNQLSSTEATSSGSTSYMSPPNKLSPAQQSLLRAILNKIEAKNKNPKLHHYIKRVLEMSRKSLDDLPVSSVSDTSINSSIFNRSTDKKRTSTSDSNRVSKYNVSCQANVSSSDDSATKEVLKFSELAESYAHRLQDLAGMLEKVRILPDTRTGEANEDSSAYLSPPSEVHHSVRLSQSVKTGAYPKPVDDSVHYHTSRKPSPCRDLPPSHIYPHPSAAVHLHPPPSLCTQSRAMAGTNLIEAVAHELSTIQEGRESQRPETPQPSRFDPDVSSIRGSPQQREGRDSTGSSLCLLDDKDISSWLGSSSDGFEEVFKSLGIGWALPTVRKTRQSQRRVSDSRSSSRSTGRGQYSHSTPLGPSPAKPRASCTAHCQSASTESDSLTPPCLSLNIPASVWPKPRRSR